MVSSTGNGCLDNKSCNLLQRKSVAAVSLLVGYEGNYYQQEYLYRLQRKRGVERVCFSLQLLLTSRLM